jgi:TonB family protein
MALARLPRLMIAQLIFCGAIAAHAGVTSELQRAIREGTFEVVMKKPEGDPVSYEKPLPLDLLPYIERTDTYRSVGTAFALGHNTYVTAAHVIEAGIGSQFGPPELRRSDGAVFAIDRILKFSMHEDFVVFSLREDPRPSGFGVNKDPKLDEPVLAVGNALGEGIVIRDGLFTSETPEAQDGRWKWIRFSAAASPGNSGGPLCDESGRVIGIVIGKSPNENLNYSLPIARVLDAEDSKARFDQKVLVSLPYMHGTVTYAYKDEYNLPLPWPAFVEAFQKLTERHGDESQAQLSKTYAESTFPRGRGRDDLLFEPAPDGAKPRLITQQADGTWSASIPNYQEIDLPADGSVSVASEASARLVHLVRSGAAADDAFYADSKGFMDLALKGLDLRRAVGADQVRVVSLGPAKSDAAFTDQYGRKWQQRVWAVPYLDAYIVGALLPTPDGYAALILLTPSIALHSAKELTQLLAGQLDVSYRGTLAQWQSALSRHALLPEALLGVKLERSPMWTLRTRRFISSVPPDVLTLSDKSPMTLTMGFMNDGPRTVWDIQEIWWDQDARRDTAIGVWRRARPPNTARLELRNRFESIRAHRTPYDGTLSRETAEIFSAMSVLDVPGNKPASISADLEYGVTVHMIGRPSLMDAENSIKSVTAATHVLERGLGEDIVAEEQPNLSMDAAFSSLEREAMARIGDANIEIGKDVRGRLIADDLHDFLQAVKKELSAMPVGGGASDSERLLGVERQRLDWLRSYWSEYPALTHNRDMWDEFLQRNHFPAATPHEAAVTDAESALLRVLGGRPSAEWAERARALRAAYIEERRDLVKRTLYRPGAADLIPRAAPCPVAATATSGTLRPRFGLSARPLDELWPTQSKRLGEEGTVMATLQVSATGCVTGMAIAGSSGSEMLDSTVLRYFESMEFIPADSNGKAIESTVTVPVVFKLKN